MEVSRAATPSFKAVIVDTKLTDELTALSTGEDTNATIRNRSTAALNAIREATNQQKTNKKVNLFVDYGSMYLGYGDTFEDSKPIEKTRRNFKEIFIIKYRTEWKDK